MSLSKLNIETKGQFRSRYASKEEIEEDIAIFKAKFNVMLDCRSSTSNQLIYHCKHGVKQKKTACKSEFTHSYFTGCPFRLSFTLLKAGYWHLARADWSHERHEIGEEVMATYAENNRLQDDVIKSLRDLADITYLKPSTLAEIASAKTGKNISSVTIKNIGLYKSKRSANLAAYLKQIKAEGGVVEKLKDDDGFSIVLLVITNKMKGRLLVEQPEIIILDTTFKTNIEQYKLVLFCYKSAVNGKTVVAALVFCDKETDENLTFAFNTYKL